MLASIPEYRVTARNTSAHSSNKIHDDAVARQYGFRGGLVPGATVYAYMTRPLLAAFGREWMERGTGSVRFLRPIYEGEEIALLASVQHADPAALEIRALSPAGELCAVATASLPDRPEPSPVDPAAYPRRGLPAERPPATRAVLEALGILGSPERLYDESAAAEYRAKFDDPNPLYLDAGGLVHPAFLLEQGNRAVDQNVRLGPWIHAGSDIRHLSAARVGERVTTRGRVLRVFERKGNEFVELDLLLVADDARPVAHLRHLAIYRLREAGA